MSALTLLAAAAACSGGGGSSGPEVEPTPLPGFLFGDTEPSQLQLDILASGETTFADYEESFFAMVRCMREANIEFLMEPTLDASGMRYTYQYRGGRTWADAEETRAKWEVCYTRHLAIVDAEWARATMPSGEEHQQALAAFAACLEEAGLYVGGSVTTDDLPRLSLEAPSVFNNCMESIKAEFGINGL